MPHAGGRPSKLTPETREKLLSAIRLGNYRETACAYAGIDPHTLGRWMKRGEREQRGEYWELCALIKDAEASAEMVSVARIRAASADTWQAAAWYLERKFPERWARSDRLDVRLLLAERVQAVAADLGLDEADVLTEAKKLLGVR